MASAVTEEGAVGAVDPDEDAQPRWLTAGEQEVWRAYLDVSRLLFERLHRQLFEDSDVTFPEYEVLVQLSETPDWSLRMSELADRAVSSRSRLTHTVGRLEDRGMVRRERSTDDRRGILCTLTPQGFELLRATAPGHVEMVRRIMFDPLDPSDVTALGAAMTKIRAVLREG